MIYVITAKRGGIVGINCYTSKEAAEIVWNKWRLTDKFYEIICLYPVDIDCVKTWEKVE